MNGRNTFFWASYADLMTSLFFVMLVLVGVLAIEKNVAQSEVDKIKEIEAATQNVDKKYFNYNDKYKKYILKIKVKYPTGEDKIQSLSHQTRQELLVAGYAIQSFIDSTIKAYPEVQYLLIIEGQASRDQYKGHYEDNMKLSYRRALGLFQYWKYHGIHFESICEPLVCGSGEGGYPRDMLDDKNNQRFLIHLVPKPGTIDHINKESDK